MNKLQYRALVTKAFDEAARGYDHPAMRFFDLAADHLVNMLPLKENDHVLDAACGTGKVALSLAQKLPKGRVIAVDQSEGMLEAARAKARQLGRTSIEFQRADLTQKKWPEASFDGLTCSFGLFFFSDMAGTLKSLIRSIKPGGFVAFTSFRAGAFLPLSKLLLDRFERFGVTLPKTYTWERLDHPDKHRGLMQDVGLREPISVEASMGYFLKNSDEWWHLVQNTGFRSFYNQLSPAQAKTFEREHREEIQPLLSSRGLRLRVPVIFSLARTEHSDHRDPAKNKSFPLLKKPRGH